MPMTAVDSTPAPPAPVHPGDLDHSEVFRLLYGEATSPDDRQMVADLATTSGVTGRVLASATGDPRADSDRQRRPSGWGPRRFRGPAQSDVEGLLWRWCRRGGTTVAVDYDDYIAGGGDEYWETDPADDPPRP